MTVAMIHRSAAMAGRCPVPVRANSRHAANAAVIARALQPVHWASAWFPRMMDQPAVARARAKPRVEIQVAREAASSRVAATGGERDARCRAAAPARPMPLATQAAASVGPAAASGSAR
jgi:hypothetical protein